MELRPLLLLLLLLLIAVCSTPSHRSYHVMDALMPRYMPRTAYNHKPLLAVTVCGNAVKKANHGKALFEYRFEVAEEPSLVDLGCLGSLLLIGRQVGICHTVIGPSDL
ncbi:uncharacterized protein V6R79_004702 [Siganus canaliculatus]